VFAPPFELPGGPIQGFRRPLTSKPSPQTLLRASNLAWLKPFALARPYTVAFRGPNEEEDVCAR